ncbi:hypothetical protein VSU19_04810 [Verrucomicrobiales bacterium BCK34]|nr:hypothetical protein [Verrucomicrobiales bacterium BCK34]
MKSRNPFIPFVLLLAVIPVTSAFAQRSDLSVREALGIVSSRFGPQSVQWIAEIYATHGIPQPSAWQILAYDERAPRLLYSFAADSSGNARDLGPDEIRYPKDVPVGYFSPNQIRLDSVAAFTVAEGEARKARMAFDSCDYLLRSREFTQDPMWRLQLLDAAGRVVGKIYISATSGQVLRTVWVYHDNTTRRDGRPLIIDSTSPSQGAMTTGISENALPPTQSMPPHSGIADFPPNPEPIPGQAGIVGAPPYQTPVQPQMVPGDTRTYTPVDPSGRPLTEAPAVAATRPPVMDDDIPEPPALTQPPSGNVPSASGMKEAPAVAPKPDPEKPPINVPSGSSGSSERIPPPPVPR